jgi:hypothetical protein
MDNNKNTLASVMFGIGVDALRHSVSSEEMEDYARDAMREENAPPSDADLEALAKSRGES